MTLTITHAIFLDLDAHARACDRKWPFMRMRNYLHEIARIADDVIVLDDELATAAHTDYRPTIH